VPIFLNYLIALLCALHVMRSGRSYLWLLLIFLLPGLGPVAYIAYVLLNDTADTRSVRRFADNVATLADPGRGYREKLREVEQVGSVKAKQGLAEECIKRGRFQDAADLYLAAMKDPLGANDTALIRGLARALLLAGDGAGSSAAFEKLHALDRAAIDDDAELDYARALALAGRKDDARAQYEWVVQRYPGEEARCRFALFLLENGEGERAAALFREIVDKVSHAPGFYRARQREWVRIARQRLSAIR
jgi:hypothetical protein